MLCVLRVLREKSVVYFTATWCPPCRRIGPFLAELSEETEGVAFGKVDIDDNKEAADMAGIKSIPTFKFFQVSERTPGPHGGYAADLCNFSRGFSAAACYVFVVECHNRCMFFCVALERGVVLVTADSIVLVSFNPFITQALWNK